MDRDREIVDVDLESVHEEDKFYAATPPPVTVIVNSLEAEITAQLSQLTHCFFEAAKQIMQAKSKDYHPQHLGIPWEPLEVQKYGCFRFYFKSPQSSLEINTFWDEVKVISQKAFGDEEAKQVFDELIAICPDGIELIVYDKQIPIFYEHIGEMHLNHILAASQAYIKDYKQGQTDKITAILDSINNKFIQAVKNTKLLYTYEAKEFFQVPLYKAGFIDHDQHRLVIRKIISEFETGVIAELSHLDTNTNFSDLNFKKVITRFRRYQQLISNDSQINCDRFYMSFPQNNIQQVAFHNRHQSSTKIQRWYDLIRKEQILTQRYGEIKQLDAKEYQDYLEEWQPRLESETSMHNQLNRLPVKSRISNGICWPSAKTHRLEIQIGIESTHFEAPLSEMDNYSPQLVLHALFNLQQQLQETRKNKIVFHLLAYNKSDAQPKLSWKSIQNLSLFISDEISYSITKNIKNRVQLTSYLFYEIMDAAIKKFQKRNPKSNIPENVYFILTGVATEICLSRTIYNYQPSVDSEVTIPHEALRLSQYWMEYHWDAINCPFPGLIYFIWTTTKKSTEEISAHNKVNLIELFLLFRFYCSQDPMAKVVGREFFVDYQKYRSDVIKIANQYLSLLTESKPYSTVETYQAHFVKVSKEQNEMLEILKNTEKTFFSIATKVYKNLSEKIFESMPDLEAGEVLKTMFKLNKSDNFEMSRVFLPCLTQLFAFFMNEIDLVSIQSVGGDSKILDKIKIFSCQRQLLCQLFDHIPQMAREVSHSEKENLIVLPPHQRPQPSITVLLQITTHYHQFFKFWVTSTKGNRFFLNHTKKLYQYCSQYWLSLPEKQALIPEKTKLDKTYSSPERELIEKLNRFWQREAIALEIQIYQKNLTEAKTSDTTPLPTYFTDTQAIIITNFYDSLTALLIIKKQEIITYCSIHHLSTEHGRLKEYVLNDPEKKRSTLKEKFDLIENINFLGLELNQMMIRGNDFFKNHQLLGKYASFTPIKYLLKVMSTLDYSSLENFIESLTDKVDLIHPDKYYRYLFRSTRPHSRLISSQLKLVKTYCNSKKNIIDKVKLIPEFKVSQRPIEEQEIKAYEKLQIYWQQQRMLIKITPPNSSDLAVPLEKFYVHFSKNLSEFKSDEKIWDFAKIPKVCHTIIDTYNLILDLYYLTLKNKTWQSPVLKQTMELIAKLSFISENQFKTTLEIVNQYLLDPQSPYAIPGVTRTYYF